MLQRNVYISRFISSIMATMTFFYNGKIYTPQGIMSWMKVSGNRIEEVGDQDALTRKYGSGNVDDFLLKIEYDKVDLQNKLVLPGLHDSHIHVYSLGRFSSRLNLKKIGSIAEMQNKIEKFAKTDQFPWIIGDGWDQDFMEDKRYPSKNDIDHLSDKPIILYRACHHIALINSKALEIMKISANTQDPEGGKIDRDSSGNPTGILRETALDLVSGYISPHYEKFKLDFFREGVNTCLKVGLTAVHTNDAKAWKYYNQLVENQELPIRVFLTIPHDELEELDTPKADQKNGLLVCKRVKLFADGSLGAATAALRENYSGMDHNGILIHSQQDLTRKIKKAHQMGYQLEVHAIGDLAAEYVVKGFKEAGITAGDRGIITHCQVLNQDLIETMATMGIIANIQPPFVPTDALWAEKRLGNTERFNYSYAWKTLIEHGVKVAGGSDAPIEPPNPFWGIYCAIIRPSPEGEEWRPKEKLDFKQSLDIYTTGGAYAIKMENELGEIAPGFLADFVVVNPDILYDHEQLKQCTPEQVWVDGIRRL